MVDQWIAMKLCLYTHGPQRMNLNAQEDPMTFPIVPLYGWFLGTIQMSSDKNDNYWIMDYHESWYGHSRPPWGWIVKMFVVS